MAKPVPTSKVHFGYTDGISQTTIRGGPERYPPDHQKPCEPWLFVLLDEAENYFVPEPRELGLNGSFAVFKMIETDVVGFENFLQSNKDKIDPELLAAKMCGRWRNGVPLALSPDTDSPPGGISPEQLNDFEYVNADGSGDPKGVRCPVGAHMRRINPRGQPVTGQGQPGGSNNTHRLIRRGMPYGPVYDPAQPYDGIERGLLGYFINSNIENQYEFVLSQWVNDSEFAGAVRLNPKSKDPMIGTQRSGGQHFRDSSGERRSSDQGHRAHRHSLRPKRRLTAFCRASPRSGSSPAWDDAAGAGEWHAVSDQMVRGDQPRRRTGSRRGSGLHRGDRRESSADAGERRGQAATSARRGTHAKGVCARAGSRYSIVTNGRDPCVGETSRQGHFRETRHLSRDGPIRQFGPAGKLRLQGRCPLAVNLRRPYPRWNGRAIGRRQRQDFSMQNATTMPLNDARAFVATMKVLTARAPSKACGRFRCEDSCVWCELGTGAVAGAPANQALSTTSLLEHSSLSPRTRGRGEADGDSVSG